ncbi:MAG: hypothetical protein ACK4ST_08980 [Elioraea tepidiphila]
MQARTVPSGTPSGMPWTSAKALSRASWMSAALAPGLAAPFGRAADRAVQQDDQRGEQGEHEPDPAADDPGGLGRRGSGAADDHLLGKGGGGQEEQEGRGEQAVGHDDSVPGGAGRAASDFSPYRIKYLVSP